MKKFKCILVGESNVGKSCIINQYFDQQFSEEYTATYSNERTIKKININDTEISLEIWDTAGQERYRTLSQLFIKNTQIALLVYDITNRKSFEELNYWYNLICEENDKNKMIFGVIANKNDLYKKQKVFFEEGKNYSDSINSSFFETTAKDYESINNVFNQLVDIYLKKGFQPENTKGTQIQKNNKVEKKKCC